VPETQSAKIKAQEKLQEPNSEKWKADQVTSLPTGHPDYGKGRKKSK
jgi:hypothetical protein